MFNYIKSIKSIDIILLLINSIFINKSADTNIFCIILFQIRLFHKYFYNYIDRISDRYKCIKHLYLINYIYANQILYTNINLYLNLNLSQNLSQNLLNIYFNSIIYFLNKYFYILCIYALLYIFYIIILDKVNNFLELNRINRFYQLHDISSIEDIMMIFNIPNQLNQLDEINIHNIAPIINLNQDLFRDRSNKISKLNKISPLKYNLKKKNRKNDYQETCSICLDSYKSQKNRIYRLLKCSHKFHAECIDEWLIDYSNNICPLCKIKINIY